MSELIHPEIRKALESLTSVGLNPAVQIKYGGILVFNTDLEFGNSFNLEKTSMDNLVNFAVLDAQDALNRKQKK